VFLSDEQERTLAAAADRIFPADLGSPGASGYGVVEYLDGQLAGGWGQGERLFRQEPFREPEDHGHGWQSPLTPAQVYAHGLAALGRLSVERHGVTFAELRPELQDEVLRDCERGEANGDFGPGLTSGAFFELLRTNVIEGVFADPRYGGNRDGSGWRWIGFPGTIAQYAQPGAAQTRGDGA
jgi:gluconate 2-dehydrogenase gamma chain